MAKKGSGGGAVGAVVFAGLVMLASIPKGAWITIGVIAFIGWLLYALASGKSENKNAQPPAAAPRQPTYRPPPNKAQAPVFRAQQHTRAPEEPVSVARAPVASSYSVPKASGRGESARWVAPGESVTIAGTSIAGGAVYVGSKLPTPSGSNDPALIDPSLPVARNGDYTQRSFGYWPSYSDLQPAARRAYLNWLAGGRKDPRADIGYVFLFFYGLERRAILDAPKIEGGQKDWDFIASELRRLLGIYRGNHSFNGYASKLLAWVNLATYSKHLYQQPLPDYEKTWEVPLHLRLVLGQCALDQVPVPAHIALAWARHEPNVAMRTPAVRCAEQFDELFKRTYQEAFNDGMVLPVNKTKLKLVYTPASAGFHGCGTVNLTFGETPDVSVLAGPVKKLQDIVEASTKELEGFSRFVGRNPTQAESLDALLLLPPTLWPEAVQSKLRDLKAHADKGMVIMRLSSLLDEFGYTSAPTKDKLASFARALEAMNLGLEPDILGGAKAPKLEETVVLFATPVHDVTSRSSPAYQAALLTLELASAVAAADGEIGPEEMRQLRTQVEGWTHLTPANQQRLRAHMRLLMDEPVSLTVLKKKLEPLEAGAKNAIAKFMAVIAQADGKVTPAEIKVLEKVYKVLGVDPKNVFTDVHAAATAAAAGATATPVAHAAGAPEPATAASPGFRLDETRIAALQRDTEQVSALLSNIFKEDDVVPGAVPAQEEIASADEQHAGKASAPAGLVGLDEAHTAFVRLLLSRPSWSRQELLDAAEDLQLMLDGALEQINDASFDVHDAALTEGEDPVEVNQDILEKQVA